MPEVETFALRASNPVLDAVEQALSHVTVTDKLEGGAVAPIVPDKVKLSVAVIVKACAPLIAPEIVCDPAVLLIEEAAVAKAISPEYVLFPDVNTIAPPEETPVPAMVIGSATVIPPEISRAPVEFTVVVPAVVPNPVAVLIASVPAEIVVDPV